MKKILTFIFIAGFLGLFGWTISYLYGKSEKQPVIFETKSPFKTNIVKKTVATGSVTPRKEIEIKPRISGIIDRIYVEAGQKLKKGDLIARVKIIPNMVNLNNAETRVRQSKINLKDAKLTYNRQKKLFDQGVLPAADFERAQTTFNTAKTELDAAKDNLQLIKEGVTKKSGRVTNTLIRATIDGMILGVPVEEGNSVIESNTFNAGTTIAMIADMNEMIFKGKVDETEVGKIKEGMKLNLSIGAIEDEKFNAKLEYISPKGTQENGAIQFEIKADVILKDSFFIRAGYSANADIVLDNRDSVMAIDESLVKFKDDSTFVFVDVNGRFEERQIKTGLSDGINIEILSGLTYEDKIRTSKIKEKKKEDKK